MSLVNRDRITESGMRKYWDSLDATFRYNMKKHETFKVRLVCGHKFGQNHHQVAGRFKEVSQEDKSRPMSVRYNDVSDEDQQRQIVMRVCDGEQ